MKVLLIEDVYNLGYAGDIKEVKNGYGRNYLLPQQLAVLATPGALKQAETIRKAAEKARAQERADAEAIANQISGVELVFERRAGETGKLYGSVTSSDIAEAMLEKTGIEIDKRKIALPEPVRSLGVQEVPIKLMIDFSAMIQVEVLPLGGILERERLSEAEAAAIASDEAEAAPIPSGEATEAVEDIEDEVASETASEELPPAESPSSSEEEEETSDAANEDEDGAEPNEI